MFIYNDDNEFVRKCIEIWDEVIELIGINNHIYFLKADKMMNYLLWQMYTSFVIEDNDRYGI